MFCFNILVAAFLAALLLQIIHNDSEEVMGQNDTSFSCDGTDSTFRVMFKEPIEIQPGENYVASSTLKVRIVMIGVLASHNKTHIHACSIGLNRFLSHKLALASGNKANPYVAKWVSTFSPHPE